MYTFTKLHDSELKDGCQIWWTSVEKHDWGNAESRLAFRNYTN